MASRQNVIRKQYLREMRDTGAVICGICDFPIIRESDLTVDHVVPKKLGGKNVVDNFQPAHLICNGLKGHELDYKLTTETKSESSTV